MKQELCFENLSTIQENQVNIIISHHSIDISSLLHLESADVSLLSNKISFPSMLRYRLYGMLRMALYIFLVIKINSALSNYNLINHF